MAAKLRLFPLNKLLFLGGSRECREERRGGEEMLEGRGGICVRWDGKKSIGCMSLPSMDVTDCIQTVPCLVQSPYLLQVRV